MMLKGLNNNSQYIPHSKQKETEHTFFSLTIGELLFLINTNLEPIVGLKPHKLLLVLENLET